MPRSPKKSAKKPVAKKSAKKPVKKSSKKGGAFEIAPLAATGLILGARHIYKTAMASPKKSPIPFVKKFSPKRRFMKRGGADALPSIPAVIDALSKEDPNLPLEVVLGRMGFVPKPEAPSVAAVPAASVEERSPWERDNSAGVGMYETTVDRPASAAMVGGRFNPNRFDNNKRPDNGNGNGGECTLDKAFRRLLAQYNIYRATPKMASPSPKAKSASMKAATVASMKADSMKADSMKAATMKAATVASMKAATVASMKSAAAASMKPSVKAATAPAWVGGSNGGFDIPQFKMPSFFGKSSDTAPATASVVEKMEGAPTDAVGEQPLPATGFAGGAKKAVKKTSPKKSAKKAVKKTSPKKSAKKTSPKKSAKKPVKKSAKKSAKKPVKKSKKSSPKKSSFLW